MGCQANYPPDISSCNTECDRAKVVALLDESLDISRELETRPLMERVLSRKEIRKA